MTAVAPPLPAFAGGSFREAQMQQNRITGTALGRGVLCPQFRLDDGEQISLEGLPPGSSAPAPGQRLRLTGSFLRASRCQQGRAFRVTAIAPAPG
ncbi:hypothetical protein [Cereibacter sphaeroides]|uniref:hypothetical protein n=1 Tax=Cereibacter sphaeroides TaxID=1063 RepID=UPI001F47C540|nr:hypothetical protein [Cereibacter sphaeroides]MCE6967294.1 hypothetical protein [Cereibacter sphaeroides]